MAEKQIYRHWKILKYLAISPVARSTSDIVNCLHLDNDYKKITKRTIERDMKQLEHEFMNELECTVQGNINYYRWKKTREVISIPGMDTQTALTFELTRQFLEPLLPRTTLKDLKPYFNAAKQLLDGLKESESHLKNWSKKVYTVSDTQRLLPADIKDSIASHIYEAVLGEKRITAEYHSHNSRATKTYDLHPLGLLFTGHMTYLVAKDDKDDKTKRFALHRFSKVSLTYQTCKPPRGFSLEDFVKEQYDIPVSSDTLKLTAVFSEEAGRHLQETPLDKHQKLSQNKTDKRWHLETQVADTKRLRWWLLGFGDGVEVLGPKKLREEMKIIATTMAKRYTK